MHIATDLLQEVDETHWLPIKPYYQKTGFTLYHANYLEILPLCSENLVDLVFADPPYLLSNNGFTVHSGKRVSVNKGEWVV